jgi:hypothetical protein
MGIVWNDLGMLRNDSKKLETVENSRNSTKQYKKGPKQYITV